MVKAFQYIPQRFFHDLEIDEHAELVELRALDFRLDDPVMTMQARTFTWIALDLMGCLECTFSFQLILRKILLQ